MTNIGLGQRSLRLDAAYCLVSGLLVLATAGKTAPMLAVHPSWVLAAGALTVSWSGLVWQLSRAPGVSALRGVLAANLVAAAVLATASATVDAALVAIVLLLVAVEVTGFAASQAIALRQVRRA